MKIKKENVIEFENDNLIEITNAPKKKENMKNKMKINEIIVYNNIKKTMTINK